MNQIKNAVVEMDKVLQNSAATAEESASASEEMIAQAGQLKGMVAELVGLVEGRRKAAGAPIDSSARARTTSRARALAGRLSAASTKAPPAPERVIPLDDEETFSDF